MIAVALIASL